MMTAMTTGPKCITDHRQPMGQTRPSNMIIYVNAEASGAEDGKNWTDAFTGLDDALYFSISGDQIWVAAGTYYPTSQPTEIDTFR